jgi:hypothetical protein
VDGIKIGVGRTGADESIAEPDRDDETQNESEGRQDE